MKEITVTYLEAGQRLDRFLGKYLKEARSGFLYKMLRRKNITLNGKKAQGNEKLCEHDVIRLFFADETLAHFTGQQGDAGTSALSAEKAASGKNASPDKNGSAQKNASGHAFSKAGKMPDAKKRYPVRKLDILYEDRDVLLISKPSGMLSQKAKDSDVSLCEYLIGYLLASGQLTERELETFRPSVCNRLDRGTSGIVCCGKTMAGLQSLSAAIAARTIRKYYQCLVFGIVREEKLLEGFIEKDEAANFSTVARQKKEGARPVRTYIRPLREGRLHTGNGNIPVTLLEAELITGRSHQIRVHLAGTGHPIVGDWKYCTGEEQKEANKACGFRSQLLHCAKLVFPKEGIPDTLAGKTITAPLPKYFPAI